MDLERNLMALSRRVCDGREVGDVCLAIEGFAASQLTAAYRARVVGIFPAHRTFTALLWAGWRVHVRTVPVSDPWPQRAYICFHVISLRL